MRIFDLSTTKLQICDGLMWRVHALCMWIWIFLMIKYSLISMFPIPVSCSTVSEVKSSRLFEEIDTLSNQIDRNKKYTHNKNERNS